jgi:low temperature requirement protein LtrA
LKSAWSNLLWGPPKKFSGRFEERKISWLELFYDLVYVIAISKITRHLAQHPGFSGLLDYVYFFAMIYWGWLNGSLHHDIHGTPGIRTRFMTLWQILVVAALIVTLNSPPETLRFNATIAIMLMQLYITYLWWSVGIYDKAHRKFNRPYTLCYLASLGIMFVTLFLDQPILRIAFYVSLTLNFLPPFILKGRLRRNDLFLNLTSSMTERLGLFTIIIFGEVVLGVINGIAALEKLNALIWINFSLGILIVFGLWWIFFALIADRESRKGFITGYFVELSYIPALMALGMIGASFSRLFAVFENPDDQNATWTKNIFGISFSIFLAGITVITHFLEYQQVFDRTKKKVQLILLAIGLFILLLTIPALGISLFTYLLIITLMLIIVIVIITRIWLAIQTKDMKNEEG